jgi:hypothetical protein
MMAVGVAIAVVRVYQFLISIHINANSWPFPGAWFGRAGGP